MKRGTEREGGREEGSEFDMEEDEKKSKRKRGESGEKGCGGG